MSLAGVTSGALSAASRKLAPGKIRASLSHAAPGVLTTIGVLIAWQAATLWASSIFFPTPVDILLRAKELWLSGPASRLWMTEGVFNDVIPSLGRMMSGWIIAALLGITVGVALARSRVLSDLLDPCLQFLRAIPGPALIPIFLILLGTESTMRISLIAFSSVWPVLLNTIEGVRTVEPGHLSTAKSFRIPRSAQMFRIIIPAAMPKIMAGLRVSLAIALILMVISEMIAATSGIGYVLSFSQQSFLLTDMWAAIVLLSLLGFTLNLIFSQIERRVLRWHAGARQRTARD